MNEVQSTALSHSLKDVKSLLSVLVLDIQPVKETRQGKKLSPLREMMFEEMLIKGFSCSPVFPC